LSKEGLSCCRQYDLSLVKSMLPSLQTTKSRYFLIVSPFMFSCPPSKTAGQQLSRLSLDLFVVLHGINAILSGRPLCPAHDRAPFSPSSIGPISSRQCSPALLAHPLRLELGVLYLPAKSSERLSLCVLLASAVSSAPRPIFLRWFFGGMA